MQFLDPSEFASESGGGHNYAYFTYEELYIHLFCFYSLRNFYSIICYNCCSPFHIFLTAQNTFQRSSMADRSKSQPSRGQVSALCLPG